ncbi:MAG: ABC transporter ATP-binding protein [Pseudomonadota bacterium]|nr:ABC transporter ATP-binding protein [Pseudomonadota bacterium]
MEIPSILVKNRIRILLCLTANGLGQSMVAIMAMLLVRSAFDNLIKHDANVQTQYIYYYGLGFIILATAKGFLRMTERIDAEKLGQNYTHQIRMLLFKSLSRSAPRTLQKRSRGAIVLRFIGDLNALKRWVSLGLVRIAVAGTIFTCSLIGLGVLNWRIAMVAGLILGVGALSVIRQGSRLREAARESRRLRSYLAANVNEKVAAIGVVQVFGQTAREQRRIRNQSKRLMESMVNKAKNIGLMRGITESIMTLSHGAILLQGVYEIQVGRATHGTVLAAVIIISFLIPALRDLSRVYEYFLEYKISSNKINEFLETPDFIRNRSAAPDLKPGPGHLEFKNICLGSTLKQINATAQAKQLIVITGSNGAGKSTLLSLVARLINPNAGRILVDGQDIGKHNLASVRRSISMVSPDLPLLRGTVRKNLLYRYPKASTEEIDRIWRLCDLGKLIDELPQGELTRITEDGHNLSLGQRQRLGLARAMLGNPRILLLDEADVHLDQEAGKILERILQEYQGTILWVTHDPKRLACADAIWQIENGSLVVVDSSEESTYMMAS